MKLVVVISFIFLIPSYLMAWDSPWNHSQTSGAPWVSVERETKRENFFSSLSSELQAAEPAAESVKDSTDDQEELSGELSEVPWDAHRTLYPKQKFIRKLSWPISGARVSSGFGLRGGRNHEGVDLSARAGEPIRTIADGRVVFNGRMNGYGNIMVVYHGDGISSIYAHNSQNLLARGTKVKRGDAVAKVGRSGRATGNHCHFEIRVDGRPVNPFLYAYSGSPYIAQK